MNNVPNIGIQCAALAISAGAFCVLLKPLRPFGWRLLVAGGVIASATAIIPAQIQSDLETARAEEVVAWIGVTGVIAAVFGARRLAVHIVTPSAVLWLLVPMAWPTLQPVMTGIVRYWWIVPVIVVAQFVATFIVAAWLKSLRAYALGSHSAHSVGRLFSHLIDRIIGFLRHGRDGGRVGHRTSGGARR